MIGEEQFENLYAEHAQPLFAFLVYRTGDRVLAEDLVADTFERALKGRRLFDRARASEKTWLYTIALNALRDHGRRRTAEGRALERQGAGGRRDMPEFEDVEYQGDLQHALGHLSDEEREAVCAVLTDAESDPALRRAFALLCAGPQSFEAT